jgi:alpha-L-fucosidase
MSNLQPAIPDGPFEPTWESLQSYQPPAWYMDGKFGIFIHWGAYCVPAFGNEWYPRQMYLQKQASGEESTEFNHHVETYGPHTKFGYKDFIPLFRAEEFNPQAWAHLFQRAGAQFVVPVAEHHDGFAMYNSALSNWTAAQMGPKRDVVGQLAEATRALGMTFGVSSHRAEHWWFFNGGRAFPSDVQDPAYEALYGPAAPDGTQPDKAFLDDWLARTCELVDKYQPQLVWFDWWIEQPAFEPYLRHFAAYYYNRGAQWGREVAINYKNKSFVEGSAVYDIERGQLSAPSPLFWQNDTSISKNSWGYIRDQDYKTATHVIGDLVDIVSKNGALLLNIGPMADGTIPQPEVEVLLEIGHWLKINGEAIYHTRPWHTFGEGPTEIPEGGFSDTKRTAFTSQDVRYSKGEALYATLLGWPKDGTVSLRSLGQSGGERITAVSLLGSTRPLQWTQEADALTVQLPADRPCEHAWVLKIG